MGIEVLPESSTRSMSIYRLTAKRGRHKPSSTAESAEVDYYS
jgi:hypothetical protein